MRLAPTMGPPVPRLVVILALLAASPACSRAAAPEGPVALQVEVRARALAPGEPLRVVVASPAPLRSLGGTFLEQKIFLLGGPDGAWSGWSMIPLDQGPGLEAIDLRGTAEDGREALGTLALTIEAKDFPREELSVAPRYVEPPPEVRTRLERERASLGSIYETRSPRLLPAAPFERPVPGEPTSVFGMRRLFNGQPRSPHPGLDLRAAEGTPVKASGPGRVVLAQDLYYSGKTVILDHGGGLYTLYAHLSSIALEEGGDVAAGEVLGLSGATGRVTGPHLHWGAKIGDRPFDPRALLDPGLFGGSPD